jgi:hypothetical protein
MPTNSPIFFKETYEKPAKPPPPPPPKKGDWKEWATSFFHNLIKEGNKR